MVERAALRELPGLEAVAVSAVLLVASELSEPLLAALQSMCLTWFLPKRPTEARQASSGL